MCGQVIVRVAIRQDLLYRNPALPEAPSWEILSGSNPSSCSCIFMKLIHCHKFHIDIDLIQVCLTMCFQYIFHAKCHQELTHLHWKEGLVKIHCEDPDPTKLGLPTSCPSWHHHLPPSPSAPDTPDSAHATPRSPRQTYRVGGKMRKGKVQRDIFQIFHLLSRDLPVGRNEERGPHLPHRWCPRCRSTCQLPSRHLEPPDRTGRWGTMRLSPSNCKICHGCNRKWKC